MTVRLATESDMTAVYLMGYDVWKRDDSQAAYLEGCRNSQKYKRGRWFVLVDNEDKAISSLIVYKLTFNLEPDAAGIGSIATPIELRKRGLASLLIGKVLAILTQEGVSRVFLFSDIAPEFYEKREFKKLPAQHQKYTDSVCMAWNKDPEYITNETDFVPPTYF